MITKDMVIGEVLREFPQTAEVFLSMGMHCLGCPSAVMEDIQSAAVVHGRDPDELVADLNKAIEK
ncbi:MAG: DUF1858 domain-containing protein [Peptococcaceae bacterium]|nr:DUF1858 domain-containing protein [Peptococcaceae bacterium]